MAVIRFYPYSPDSPDSLSGSGLSGSATVCADEKFIKVRIADETFCNNGFQSVVQSVKKRKCHRHDPYYQVAFLGFIAINRTNTLLYRPNLWFLKPC
jgi:hypothetical protein